MLENLDAQNIVIDQLHRMPEKLINNNTDNKMNVQPERCTLCLTGGCKACKQVTLDTDKFT